jgi:hypothetical protein
LFEQAMPDVDCYILRWHFSPPEFFEEPVAFETAHGRIEVGLGKAEMRAPISVFQSSTAAAVCSLMHIELSARFIGAQVQSHSSFVLERPAISILHSDGTITALAFAGIGTVRAVAPGIDFISTDENGNVVHDSRKERITRKRELAELAARHFDHPVANALLRSHAASVTDPENELIHLYEIRDALTAEFPDPPGTKRDQKGSAAATAVGAELEKLTRLHELACNLPLAQGRHRGTHRGRLREATKEELEEARSITRAMIEGYLRLLG